MLTRRTSLLSSLTMMLLPLQRLLADEDRSSLAASSRNSIFLHVYSGHHRSTHDPDRKEPPKRIAEVPIWTRVLTMLIVPDVDYFVRCPSNRDPDIRVEGKISRRRDGTLAGNELVVYVDDTNMTHQNHFIGEISLDRIHPNSDVSFRYVFSEIDDPYDVLSKLARGG